MQLLISGTVTGEDPRKGVLAILLVLDTRTGRVVHRTEYTPPPSLAYPERKVQFTGWTFIDDRLYVCSHNEIVVFDQWPPTKPADRITVRGFNDLHHCMPWRGGIAVSNTGLETVDHVSLDGELLDRWDLLADEPEARRIDPQIDYRLRADTKPHLRHANHLFERDGALWTGQLRTGDAICVTDPSQRLEMGAGMPHDGTWLDGRLVFTTTNGHLVFFDFPEDQAPRRQIYSLSEMTPDLEQLGWCRGICGVPGQPHRYFVGFSAARRTKWIEFGYWIKHRHQQPPSRVALYDLEARAMVEDWSIGDDSSSGGDLGHPIFQIEVLPDRLWL